MFLIYVFCSHHSSQVEHIQTITANQSVLYNFRTEILSFYNKARFFERY